MIANLAYLQDLPGTNNFLPALINLQLTRVEGHHKDTIRADNRHHQVIAIRVAVSIRVLILIPRLNNPPIELHQNSRKSRICGRRMPTLPPLMRGTDL